MKLPMLFAFAVLAACAADNAITPAEQREGWKLLFDGKTMNGWRDPAKETPPGDSWAIEDGCLKTRLKPRIEEDLVSAETYRDFEFKFDWRISKGGNTGVKYRIQRLLFVDSTKTQTGPGGFEGMLGREIANPKADRAKLAPTAKAFEYVIGFEFQLLDDERHPDAKKDESHKTGALYSMIPPSAHPARPAGDWNQSRLVVKGDHVEHWINGVKAMDGSLNSEAVRAGAATRWSEVPAILDALTKPKSEGPISLQHHGDEVWFRNLKIRRF
jgi:hypothetical protein